MQNQVLLISLFFIKKKLKTLSNYNAFFFEKGGARLCKKTNFVLGSGAIKNGGVRLWKEQDYAKYCIFILK